MRTMAFGKPASRGVFTGEAAFEKALKLKKASFIDTFLIGAFRLRF
jgi:hypothetical protein